MKSNLWNSIALGLLCLGATLGSGRGQVVVNPNLIQGTLQFTNTNPAILSLLGPPGNEGISNVYVTASSVPPADPRSAASDYLLATSGLSAPYQITVDSANPGIAYVVAPIAYLDQGHAYYYFNTLTSAPVVLGGPPITLDFAECVGVVTVRFVTSGGAPVAVDGGHIAASDYPVTRATGGRWDIAPGVTEQRIYLQGGQTHQLNVTINRGTNFYTDRLDFALTTNVAVVCDDFNTVDVAIPDAGTLGRIIGNVDLLGEFENVVLGNTSSVNYPDYTTVIANYGPFSNQRWDALPGVNFTTPSSGSFVLSNVVPSTLDPASVGYAVSAQMFIRTNPQVEYFRTPGLGWGANPAVVVTPGATVDLGDTFTIQPGYLRGRILLQGPSESPGQPSLLRGVTHAASSDLDGDGLPDYLGTYGVYWTTVGAVGVDRLAPGATLTASYGYGYGDFPGAFNPVNSAYEGQYELALGGLKSEPTLWNPEYLSLFFSSGTVTNESDYYYSAVTITDRRTNEVQIVPSGTVTHDLAYCFSEVNLVYHSTAGFFYAPQVRYSTGTFTNTDFQGNPADYLLNVDAWGYPYDQASATNVGQVNMVLPQGAYRLYPSVTPADTLYGQVGLSPIDVTVGCGQRINLQPCLQLVLDSPLCSSTLAMPIAGHVRSCSNDVWLITYSLNGGPPQVVCAGCGADPTFSFVLTLDAECTDNTLTVEATDDFGGTSSITTAIRADTQAPVLQCPISPVVSCGDTNGSVVNFTVTATDNCPAPVTIVCIPPSGSFFPTGTTTVNCTASDSCGNASACSFQVGTGSAQLSIEPAVIVRWDCPGTLQGAANVDGPYTDIPGATSPYASPASDPRKFFRVRN